MPESASPIAVDTDGRLLLFATHLRRRHTVAALQGALLRIGIALALPAIAVAWWLPATRFVVAGAFAAVAIAAAIVAAVRARAVADEALLRADPAAPPAAGAAAAGANASEANGIVGDELATWLDHRRRDGRDAPMVGWLGRDLAGRIPAVPAAAIAGAGRRSLGRLRRLVPLVVLALLCWIVSEWLKPTWPGLLGGGATEPSSSSGGGEGENGAGNGAGGDGPSDPNDQPPPEPATDERRPPEAPPPTPPPPSPPEGKPEDVEPEKPAPLLELPEQQRFVVPEFVGDGPTRRAKMHAAEVERAPVGSQQRNGGGGDAERETPPLPAREEFEHAAEAAQRARHVPPEERPMVKRFFELLREKAK